MSEEAVTGLIGGSGRQLEILYKFSGLLEKACPSSPRPAPRIVSSEDILDPHCHLPAYALLLLWGQPCVRANRGIRGIGGWAELQRVYVQWMRQSMGNRP